MEGDRQLSEDLRSHRSALGKRRTPASSPRPLEVFLYDWWPIRAEGRLLQRLSTMPVRIEYIETAPLTRGARTGLKCQPQRVQGAR
jgi:hypothetical protein